MAAVRTSIRWLVLATLAIAVVGLLVVFDPIGPLLGDDEPPGPTQRDRSEIAISTLTATVEADGELAYAAGRPVTAAGGRVTAIASSGDEILPGSVVAELDGVPTVALVGTVPAWRTMEVGDVGTDVAQLEQNLTSLGYDTSGQLTVDETFTDYTAVVVERWQEDVGLPVTGVVPLGSVVFVPDGASVTAATAAVGDVVPGSASEPTPILTVSSTDRTLTFTVEPEQLGSIAAGTEVTVRLPDRTTLTAVVAEIGSTGTGDWRATATLAAEDQEAVPDGEVVPVDVSWTHVLAEEVTTVRANALTRLDDGSYVIEVVVGGDATRFVAVEVGARSGSTVEIVTDLEPGTTVITP